MATVQCSVVPSSPTRARTVALPAGRGRGARRGAPVATRRDPARPAGRPVRPLGGGAGRPVRGGWCADPEGAGRGRESWDRPPVRLTRRGRRAVAGLSVLIGLGLAAATIAVAGPDEGSGFRLVGVETVVVHPGDSLWSIAREVDPEEDPRGVVDAIVDLNALDGVGLRPGQVLQLP
jgi:nucleoid-associated protein YgaU